MAGKNIILTVDDTPSVRMLVAKLLGTLGVEVAEAEDGQAALHQVAAIKSSGNTLKLIVTDLNMPNMDGMTFIREVRKSDRTTPILMLTTVSQDDRKREGKEAGANGWAVKPLVPDVFLATVRKLTGL